MNDYAGERISTTHQHQLYFWTATINGWKHLLAEDEMKLEIIQSLQWLKVRQLISVYAYVIMPNHMHLVWELYAPNGKESAKGSLLKFTAHCFRQILLDTNPAVLETYQSSASNKTHEFWQPDSQAFPLYSQSIINQKIDYIHNNPVSGKWQLAPTADAYRFSSASFYQSGVDEFGFLTHIGEVFHA